MYWYDVEDLFFYSVDETLQNYRQVKHALLPVGMKIHCVSDEGLFNVLFDCLIGTIDSGDQRTPLHVKHANMFKQEAGAWCFVLPPVGNSDAASALISHLERITGAKLFKSTNYQIQLCAPGKLEGRDAAILSILFYASSDIIRRFNSKEQLKTTFSGHGKTCIACGIRPVLHGVGGQTSTFDRNFLYYTKDANGSKQVYFRLPWKSGKHRTDILAGPCTKGDIKRFNLISSLLVHRRYGGFWAELGEKLYDRTLQIMVEHQIGYMLDFPWVHSSFVQKPSSIEDDLVFDAIVELHELLHDEAKNLSSSTSWEEQLLLKRGTLSGKVLSLLDELEEEIKKEK